MKKLALTFFLILSSFMLNAQAPNSDTLDLEDAEEQFKYDFEHTKDPALGYPPTIELRTTRNALRSGNNSSQTHRAIQGATWQERGPSNIGGRTRAIMYDPNDVNGKKVWAGSVSGGLWYNNDITTSASGWIKVNDFWDDLAITAITYNPLNTQEFYLGMGEGWSNADAHIGDGIWKSTDGGVTWAQLPSTLSSFFDYVQKIVIHPITGDIYAATKNKGVMRSQDGGTTWNQVLGISNGATQNTAADLEIGADNTVYASIGIFNTDGIYSSTTGNSGAWTKLNTGTNGFPTSGFQRIEFATAPSNANIVVALVQNTSGVPSILTTSNKGATWIAVTSPVDVYANNNNDFTHGQGWYDFAIGIDPNNANNIFIGGVHLYKSTDAGSTWTEISAWSGYQQYPPGGSYASVHVDQHTILFKKNSSSEAIFGNDGGIYYTSTATNSLPTITSRIKDYNVTQFYKCAIHPTAATDFFLAGAQDQGIIRFNQVGINNNATNVYSGDGFFCAIDQLNPMYQVGSSANTPITDYSRSTNGGASFFGIGAGGYGSAFNPTDYDYVGKILYGNYNSNVLKRETNWNSASVVLGTVNIPGIGFPDLIKVSPYINTNVFITGGNQIIKISNADGASPTTSTAIPVTGLAGSISCLEFGVDEMHMLVTSANYGVISVWETSNGGTTWSNKEGNLPNMPIWWALYNPNNRKEVLLATELGVWSTDDISVSAPNWQATNTGFANVKVTQLATRSSDNLVIASTYGRGLFSSTLFSHPVAHFLYSTTCVGGTISFTDQSVLAPTSWFWDFGDGNTSTLQNPTHVYSTTGVYNVTLTSTNSSGSGSITQAITIVQALNLPVTVVNSNSCVTPNGTISLAVSGGTSPYNYSWNTTPVQTTAAISNLGTGNYIVTVTDINGCTNSTSANIYTILPIAFYDIKNMPSNIIHISTNTIWNSNHVVLGQVIIDPGYTLTINNNAIIQFADSKTTGIPTGITVMPGSKLLVTGAGTTLTGVTSCSSDMWDGVYVRGNSTQAQSLTTQGVVFLQNNCTVKNARTAFSVGGHTSGDAGGYIVAVVANFINNYIDINLFPYTAPLVGGNEPSNKTVFQNSNFIGNNFLNDPTYIDNSANRLTTSQHVIIRGVKNIGFNKCLFKTYLGGTYPLPSNYPSNDRSYGIYSVDASFSITNNSIFENLRYGVNASATNTLKTFNTDHSTFKNCFASIYQSNINYSSVIFNTFLINTTMPPVTGKSCAINPLNCSVYFYYLNQCNGYIHQENNYTVTGGLPVLGTIFNASTGVSNLSYRNTYTGLDKGHQAQAGNSSLQISCNTNSSVITADNIIASQGINPSQGNSAQAAGNVFSHHSPDGDIKVSSVANSLNYFYFNSGLQVPVDYTTSKVNIVPTLNANGCLTNYPISPCGGNPSNCRIANVIGINQQIKTDQQILEQEANPLLNQQLINQINISNDGQVQQLLLPKSPYINDDVLIAFLQHSPNFSNGIIKNVILANSPLNPTVMNVVNSLNLPRGILNQIKSAQTGINSTALLQAQIQNLIKQKYMNIHFALNLLLLDTSGRNNNDTIKLLFSLDNSVISKTDRISQLIDLNAYTDAQTLIDSVKVLPGMANISTVHQHKLNLKQANKNWDAMISDAVLKQSITNIALDSTQIGFAAAGSALTSVYQTMGYEEIEALQSGTGSRIGSQESFIQIDAINTDENFKAYPNPTTGELKVNYSIEDPTCNEATLQLIELSTGRLLLRKTVKCDATHTTLDLRELPNGIFALSIHSDGVPPKTIRIVKVQ